MGIARNTTIPVKKSEMFSTAVDNQTNVEIHILQGERDLVAGNKSLGNFRLDGIRQADRGIPQIEVTFDIDVDGILSVKAREKETGVEQSVTIQGASTLNETEVEEMLVEAEKELSTLKSKISEEKQKEITTLIEKIRQNSQNDDFESLKFQVDDLKLIMKEIVTAKYSNEDESSANSMSDLNDI